MDQAANNDLRVNGAGTASGGTYHDVQVNGAGTITGDITCESLVGNGALQVQGAVTCTRLEANGSADIRGAIRADTAKFSGAAKFGGDADVRDLRAGGSLKVQGSLKGETAHLSGAVDIGGDCTAEAFEVHGAFHVGGLLNAGRIEIELHGDSRARAIGGETIRVEEGHDPLGIGKLFHRIIGRDCYLTADTIEGDYVHLERTRAQTVRGRRVFIGPGCQIGLVEYTESLERAPDAVVTDARQG